MADPTDNVAELIREVTRTRDEIMRADSVRLEKIAAKADKGELDRLADHVAKNVAALQVAVNSISRKIGRPGASALGGEFSPGAERAAARGLLELKHMVRQPKADPLHVFNPSEDDLTEAEIACKAMRHVLKLSGGIEGLDGIQRKALSSFALGSSGWLLPPDWSQTILSCLQAKTDLTGLVTNLTTTGSSLKLFKDSAEFDDAAWGCDVDCFGATQIKNITDGLSEVEIKPEPLRYVLCSSRDIIDDAAVDIEQWLFRKVSNAVTRTVSSAMVTGTGVGKPQGILHGSSGIPICDTSPNDPVGQFTWQSLILLKFQVPVQWHGPGPPI